MWRFGHASAWRNTTLNLYLMKCTGGFKMIYFYSGTPGSGKSLSVSRDLITKIRVSKQNVISNMIIDHEYLYKLNLPMKIKKKFKKKYNSSFGVHVYKKNNELTPEFLYQYAFENHKKGQEGQTLIIIDEAQNIFSPTVVKLKTQEEKDYRVKWLEFFTQHRHLGYNVILISQFDKLIDPQIRCLFEFNIIHRQANSFGFIGMILSILKLKLFVRVTYFYGLNQRISSEYFFYRKKLSLLYDSYSSWDLFLELRQKQIFKSLVLDYKYFSSSLKETVKFFNIV